MVRAQELVTRAALPGTCNTCTWGERGRPHEDGDVPTQETTSSSCTPEPPTADAMSYCVICQRGHSHRYGCCPHLAVRGLATWILLKETLNPPCLSSCETQVLPLALLISSCASQVAKVSSSAVQEKAQTSSSYGPIGQDHKECPLFDL